MKTCGERIAGLREKRGLTQEELSGKLDISRASLSHYEKGRREPDLDTLNRIATFFHTSVDYLLGRTEEPQTELSSEVREFSSKLELSDEEILRAFSLTIDGKELTPEEAKRFIAFIRAERSMS